MQEMGAPRSLREKQRREREELIIQIAEEVLMEKGYHDMSMDEIAARVGIAKGTLYLHFAKKEDLVLALLERELQAILQMFQHTIEIGGSAQARLEFILKSMYEGMLGKRGRLFAVLVGAVELKSALKEKHGNLMAQVLACITGLLDEGKERGEFDPTLPTEVMVSTFFCITPSRIYKQLLLEGTVSVEELVHNLAKIYFRGIGLPMTRNISS